MTIAHIRPHPTLARRAAWVALAAPAALLPGCGAGRAASDSAAPPATGGEPQIVTLRATEFSFGVPTVRVQVDRPVRLVMENRGLIEHDVKVVKVPARDVKTSGEAHGHAGEVASHSLPGKQAWVEFTPTRKGTYSLECTVPGHKDAGMKGTLVVE